MFNFEANFASLQQTIDLKNALICVLVYRLLLAPYFEVFLARFWQGISGFVVGNSLRFFRSLLCSVNYCVEPLWLRWLKFIGKINEMAIDFETVVPVEGKMVLSDKLGYYVVETLINGVVYQVDVGGVDVISQNFGLMLQKLAQSNCSDLIKSEMSMPNSQHHPTQCLHTNAIRFVGPEVDSVPHVYGMGFTLEKDVFATPAHVWDALDFEFCSVESIRLNGDKSPIVRSIPLSKLKSNMDILVEGCVDGLDLVIFTVPNLSSMLGVKNKKSGIVRKGSPVEVRGSSAYKTLLQSSGAVSGPYEKGKCLFEHTASTVPSYSGCPIMYKDLVIGMHIGASRSSNLGMNIRIIYRLLEFSRDSSHIVESSAVDYGVFKEKTRDVDNEDFSINNYCVVKTKKGGAYVLQDTRRYMDDVVARADATARHLNIVADGETVSWKQCMTKADARRINRDIHDSGRSFAQTGCWADDLVDTDSDYSVEKKADDSKKKRKRGKKGKAKAKQSGKQQPLSDIVVQVSIPDNIRREVSIPTPVPVLAENVRAMNIRYSEPEEFNKHLQRCGTTTARDVKPMKSTKAFNKAMEDNYDLIQGFGIPDVTAQGEVESLNNQTKNIHVIPKPDEKVLEETVEKILPRYPKSSLHEFWSNIDDEVSFDEAFTIALADVDRSSSPGFPYLKMAGGMTNGDFLDRYLGLVKELVHARIKLLASTPVEIVAKYTGPEKVEAGLCDPIRIFVKREPHKLKKIKARTFRLIWSISLVDSICERMLYARQNKREILNWFDVPSKPGMGFTDEHIRLIYDNVMQARSKMTLVDSDVSAWDMSVPEWLLKLDVVRRSRLNGSPVGSVWHTVSSNRMECMCDSVIVTSSGDCFSQKIKGIQKSGTYITGSTNSSMRVMVATILGSDFIIAMGDDAVEHSFDGFEQKYADFGLPVKQSNKVETGFNFCSHNFLKRESDDKPIAIPENLGKGVVNLLLFNSDMHCTREARWASFLDDYRYIDSGIIEEVKQALHRYGWWDQDFAVGGDGQNNIRKET